MVLDYNKLKYIKTFGNSMFPLLQDGDVVYIKKKKFERIEVNNIVCAKKGGRLFTHRVIYRTKKYLITKGDNNLISDHKIYPKNIIGIVKNVKRRGVLLDIDSIYLIQSAVYFNILVEVKKSFELEGVDFSFTKGLPVHLLYEGRHPRRIYADCDLLINKKDKSKCIKVLRMLGFKKMKSHSPSLYVDAEKDKPEHVYYKRVDGLPIFLDLHYEIWFTGRVGKLHSLYPQSYLDKMTKEFLNEKRSIVLNGESFPVLSKETLFIYLCLHLYNHKFIGPYRFDLINTIIEKENLDFDKVKTIIFRYELQNYIYPCLILLRKYYKRVDYDFMESLRPKEKIAQFLMTRISRTVIFNDETEGASASVGRFFETVCLSPLSLTEKVSAFLNRRVLNAIAWTIRHKFIHAFFFF